MSTSTPSPGSGVTSIVGTPDGAAVDGLISRLNVIDQQPLDQRAVAFAQIHDELRSVLDNTGSSPR